MPNHVRNVMKIKGIKPKDIDYILNKLAVKYKSAELGTEEWIMDFDLIIPEPRYKKDCPKDCIVNKDSHVMEDEDRPWFNWYDWHCTYWGTKWNAYDGYTKIGKTQLTFVFSTAWSFPLPVATKIGDFCYKSGYSFEFKYADEDIGNNCGKLIYDAEKDELTHYTEKDLSNPVRFARDIWNRY